MSSWHFWHHQVPGWGPEKWIYNRKPKKIIIILIANTSGFCFFFILVVVIKLQPIIIAIMMYLWGQRQQCPPAQTLKVLLKKMYHSARKKNKKKTCISFILAKHLWAKHTLNIRLQSSLQQSRAKLLPLWNTHLSLQLSISSTANLYFLIQKVNASILKYHIYSCIMQLLKTSFWS